MSTSTRVWRRSTIEAAECLAYYRAVARGVEQPSEAAACGSAFHAAAAAYISDLWAHRVPADQELARAAFTRAMADAAVPASLLPETHELYWRFAESFALDLEAYLQVERDLTTERDGQAFRWRPDLVYARGDGILIYDWKTHWAPWTEAQARAAFQSRFYLLMATHHWPNHPRYVLRYRFVRLGVEVDVSYAPEELVAIEREVEALLAVIRDAERTDHYPATPGPLCAFCRLACPLVQEPALAPVRIDSPEAFARVAGQYLATDRQRELLRQALRAYTTATGPQTAHGFVFGAWPRRSARYPLAAVAQVLEAHGVPMPPALRVSQTELGDLVDPRKHPSLARALAEVAEAHTSYVFDARPARAEGRVREEA